LKEKVKVGLDGDNIKVDANLTAQDVKTLYSENKQYLPSKEQVISGAKATGNAIQNSGVLDEPKKDKKDPLTSLFGFGAKKK